MIINVKGSMMKNIVILMGALTLLSGCVTPQSSTTRNQQESETISIKNPKDSQQNLMDMKKPVEITVPEKGKIPPPEKKTLLDKITPEQTVSSYGQKQGNPAINAVPVGKVDVREPADIKRDVMALSFMNNKKAKPPKNTNIYKPLIGYIGGNSNDIISLLGNPTRERNDPKVRVWQYQYAFNGRHCWVDVYMYPRGGKYQAQYIELRGIKMSEKSRRECFAQKYQIQ